MPRRHDSGRHTAAEPPKSLPRPGALLGQQRHGDRGYRDLIEPPSPTSHRPDPDTALGFLEQLPALVLLGRLPVPVLAVAQDGLVIYMNRAIEHMLGYPQDRLGGCSIGDLVQTASPPRSAVEELHESAGKIVALTHRDGSTVRAAISKSTLERHDDQVMLVCFQDVTEQLWGGGDTPHFE